MTASVSVIIPTYKRSQSLLKTLDEILKCDPLPSEILVHVDNGDHETQPAISDLHECVKVFASQQRQGPGGGRNILLAECNFDTIVSLDDDSYPMDMDFFATVQKSFLENSSVGIVAMKIIHDDEPIEPRKDLKVEAADFVGCGCAYRRAAIAQIHGYLPLQPAYGMEEVDVALQVIDQGYTILMDHDLRIRHATNRAHQISSNIVAAHIKNTLLLACVRYPLALFGLGLLQYFNRILYSTKRGHFGGVASGLFGTPLHLWRYRKYRAPVKRATVNKMRHMRRLPQ